MINVESLNNIGVNASEVLEFWGSIDAYSESLEEFYKELPGKLKELETYKNNKEISSYTILVHGMKSECRYLGLNDASEIFYKHELKGKENNIDYIRSNFDEIESVIKNILNKLQTYFENTKIKKTILVTDDSNIIINYIESIISEDYNVIRANNGIEAINKLDGIYALLLDLNMPNCNGIEVLNYLRDNNLMEKIPVVIVTGDNTKETIKEVINYNVLDVLNKPFTKENIKKVMESIENFKSIEK